jgi:hypothetical protein
MGSLPALFLHVSSGFRDVCVELVNISFLEILMCLSIFFLKSHTSQEINLKELSHILNFLFLLIQIILLGFHQWKKWDIIFGVVRYCNKSSKEIYVSILGV